MLLNLKLIIMLKPKFIFFDDFKTKLKKRNKNKVNKKLKRINFLILEIRKECRGNKTIL